MVFGMGIVLMAISFLGGIGCGVKMGEGSVEGNPIKNPFFNICVLTDRGNWCLSDQGRMICR